MTNPDTEDDVSTSLFELIAGIGFSIGGLTDEIKKLNNHNDVEAAVTRRNLPRQIVLVQQSTNTNPTYFLTFGGPQAGRKWEARIISAVQGPSTGFATLATTISTWYVGKRATGNFAGALPLSIIRWQFTSVPGFKDFSADQFQVNPNEELMVGLTGVPAPPTSISCIAVINDLPLFSARAVSAT